MENEKTILDEIDALDKTIKEQRDRIAVLEEQLAASDAALKRAEKFWGERQVDVMNLAQVLQNEKLKSAQIEAQAMKKMIRLAQFAAVRLICKWGFAASLQLCKKNCDLILEKLSIVLTTGFIVDAFCEVLGITREELLVDSNFQWEEKLKQALSDNRVLRRDDDFSDIGGKLSLKSCCQMNKCGTSECREKKDSETK